MIDRNSPIPIYFQLKEILKQKIKNGETLPNQVIESESKLCEKYKVSRNTVRKVFADLKSEGYIYQLQGKGTFVNQPKISNRFVTTVSFTQEILARGMKPSTILLDLREIPAGREISRHLGIGKEEKVIRIYRLRMADGEPAGLNLTHIPSRICPGLMSEDLTKGSLYTLIQDKYQFQITKVSRLYETVPSTGEIRDLLRVDLGSPVLKITGVAYNNFGTAVDYCIEHYK
jgi:GntR family transcriptional regulator